MTTAVLDAKAQALLSELLGSPTLTELQVTPTTSAQNITAPSGTAYNSVKVSAVTSAIDSDITPENIKKDVDILGVVGILE